MIKPEDLITVIKEGSVQSGRSWYSLLLFLGLHQGIPVLTFTSQTSRNRNQPGSNYLSTIVSGLRECHSHLSDQDIREYLQNAGVLEPGL